MICSILLTIAFAWLLIRPHLSQALADTQSANLDSALDYATADRKTRLVQLLKDLELDFATAKIDQREYDQAKNSLKQELGQILESS